MKPDISEARRFIQDLTGDASTPFTSQTFDDGPQRRPELARILHGTIDEHFKTLCELSERGAGVFICVNQTDLNGRRAENVTAIRAFFFDCDNGSLSVQSPLLISMSVQSKRGPQGYYILKQPSADLGSFAGVQRAIAEMLKTDASVIDLPRVLRLPGFPHLKDIKNPFMVRVIGENPARYSADDFAKAFPPVATVTPIRRQLENSAQVDQSHALKRAGEFLAGLNMASQGERASRCYENAGRLKDFGLSEQNTVNIMTEKWKCEPPLTPEELGHQVSCAFKYGQNSPGVDAPEAQFEAIQPDPNQPAKSDPIFDLNKDHLVVNENGHALIYKEAHDSVLNRNILQRLEFMDFKKLYSNSWVEIPRKDDKPKILSLADAWIQSPKRRQYLGGVTFDPKEKCAPDVYNMWRGYAVKPVKGDWSKIREYIRVVICDENEVLFKYLLGWLCNMFRNPGEPGQVAIVLIGPKGIGKSTLVELLLYICGQHGLEVSQATQLTGRFLAHLRDAVFVAADESYWAGDRSAEGQLKAIITNRYLSLEGKFQAPVTAKNMIHLMLITNDDWAAPASLKDERRYAVCPVSSRYQRDRKYFGDVREEAFKNGGLEAMLHYFLNEHDLAGFDVTDFPNNAGLTDQKVKSLRGVDRWLFECLNSCQLSHFDWSDRPLEVSKDGLYADYEAWSKRREYAPTERSHWARIVKQHFPMPLVEDFRPYGGQRSWRFSAVSECREAFTKNNRLVGIEWAEAPSVGSVDDLL